MSASRSFGSSVGFSHDAAAITLIAPLNPLLTMVVPSIGSSAIAIVEVRQLGQIAVEPDPQEERAAEAGGDGHQAALEIDPGSLERGHEAGHGGLGADEG